MSANPVVLIVTHSNDHEGVELVSDAIIERGGQVFRFDTDRFPTEVQIQVEYNGTAERVQLVDGDQLLDTSNVTAVWYRRVATGRNLPHSMDPQLRTISLEECRATVNGLIVSLDGFHCNGVTHVRRADNKQLQLKLARESGLDVPRTLIGNNPTAVRELAADCDGEIVVKTLTSFAVNDEGREMVMYTNPVSAADLEHLENLRYGPCTFQENLPKSFELRVIVIGDKVFAASIDSQKSPTSATDWRKDGLGLIEDWQHYELPDDIEQKLLRLMQQLQLCYGAADFVVTPDGRHVFLEVNPAGEYFWLEKFSPYFPIADSIADCLIRGSKPQS